LEVVTIDLKPFDIESAIASYILLSDKYYILVETGPKVTVNNLLSTLKEEVGIKPNEIDYVIVTHIHLDHAGAVGTLIKSMKNAKVFVHPRGYRYLNNPSKLWKSTLDTLGDVGKYYGEPLPVPRSKLVSIDDKATLDIDEDTMLFLHTPGHANHHMIIYLVESNILFSGDALGYYYLGRIMPNTPKPHKYEDAVSSLKRLKSLKINKVYFTHFGECKLGNKVIDLALEKWKLWHDVLWEAYKNDLSIDEAYKKLLDSDKDLALLSSRVFKPRPYGKHELKVNVEGFIEYFRWKYEG